MKHGLAIALLLACAQSLYAQVIEVHGGSSSLYDSKGGEFEIKGNNYDASFGAGTVGSRFMGGANLSRRLQKSTVTLGTETIPFNLPTDIFDHTHFLTTVGASVHTTLPNASFLLFGGMASETVDGPFFQGTRGEQPAAVLLFDGRVTPTVSIASRMVLAKQISIIQGIAWHPVHWAQLAASGGIGAGKGYGAVSTELKFSTVDLKAAYIQASPGFRRADVDTVLSAEPNRLNAVVTYSPNRNFSASAGHSQYLMPVAGSDADTRSSIDQIDANTQVKSVGLSASVFRSTYQGGQNKAFVLSASTAFGPRLRVEGSYLHSASSQGPTTTATVANFYETLSARWSISEIVNTSNGQTTVGFGTSFLSNLATFSADYETYYLPEHLPSPFEQALIMSADLNLFGRLSLHGGTFVAPDGTVKHTAAANGTFSRFGDGAGAIERSHIDKYVIVGRVVDQLGQPVEGAALLIDLVPVYTDSDGTFSLRERQSRHHSIQLLVQKFLDGGDYMIINATHNIKSTLPEDGSVTVLVVQRIPKTCDRIPCKG